MPDAAPVPPAPTYELTDAAISLLSEAQTRVYARQADVAQARAHLSSAEDACSEALTELNRVIHTLLAAPRGVGESKSPA